MELHTRLSLIAQYDDFCRHSTVLSKGCDKEFKMFADFEKLFRQKYKALESENKQLRNQVGCLETDKLRLEAQLKQAKSLLITENEKSRRFELEKNSLERQIALIKELLADRNGIDNNTKERLVQLSSATSQHNDYMSKLRTIEESASLLSSSDCDETIDGLDSRVFQSTDTSKKRQKSGVAVSKNKKLLGSSTSCAVEDPFSHDENIERRKSWVTFRSSSEPSTTFLEDPVPRQIIRSDSEHLFGGKKSIKINRNSLPVGRYSDGGNLEKIHTFALKTFIRSERCNPCGKIIKFCKQGLKCSVCRMSSHIECKEECPLPCIPAISTPSKGSLGTVADYTASTSPMIPSLLVHCINEIEARGFEDLGLYRVPGRERQVKELKEKFLKGKTIPLLSEIDIHVVCGVVKEFLRSLKDSLITKAAWDSFVDAANNSNEKTRLKHLYMAICELPQPNKETLAFLILHLQRVASAPLCKMPLNNLSKVFAPTVVGYSKDEPAETNIFYETQQQNKVMEGLLKISADLWENIFNKECNQHHALLKTPDSLPAPSTSRLGPIYSSSSLLSTVVKTKLAPRNAKPAGKKLYFSSPVLK